MAIQKENYSAMSADRKECLAVVNMLIDCVALAALPAALTQQLEEAQQLIWAREYYQDVEALRGATFKCNSMQGPRQQSLALALAKAKQPISSRPNSFHNAAEISAQDPHPNCDALSSPQSLSHASTFPHVSSRKSTRHLNKRGSLEGKSAAEESGVLSPRLLLRQRQRARSGDENSDKSASDSANKSINDHSSRRSGGLVGVLMSQSSSSRARVSNPVAAAAEPRPRAKWTSMRSRNAAPFADPGWSFAGVNLKRARSTQTVFKSNSSGASKLKKAAEIIRAAGDASALDVGTAHSSAAGTAEEGAKGKTEKTGSKSDGKSTTKKKKAKKKLLMELPSEYLNRRFSELSTLEVRLPETSNIFFNLKNAITRDRLSV